MKINGVELKNINREYSKETRDDTYNAEVYIDGEYVGSWVHGSSPLDTDYTMGYREQGLLKARLKEFFLNNPGEGLTDIFGYEVGSNFGRKKAFHTLDEYLEELLKMDNLEKRFLSLEEDEVALMACPGDNSQIKTFRLAAEEDPVEIAKTKFIPSYRVFAKGTEFTL